MATREEYLQVVNKIYKARYFNIRRNGTIICKCCKRQSQTPMVHVDHVRTVHPEFIGFCPYCQGVRIVGANGRISKKSTIHLKFCCFFHKIENGRFRKLINDINNVPDVMNLPRANDVAASSSSNIPSTGDSFQDRTKILKTSMLTLQRLITYSRFLLNVVQYEFIPMSNAAATTTAAAAAVAAATDTTKTLLEKPNTIPKYCDSVIYEHECNYYDYDDNEDEDEDNIATTSRSAISTLPISSSDGETNQLCIQEQYMKDFHSVYTLTDQRYPHWWRINLKELSVNYDIMIARNQLTFAAEQNIDCRLIRIMSLHWQNYIAFRYTINYSIFRKNIVRFKQCINNEIFIIPRYMDMFVDRNIHVKIDEYIQVSFIIIGQRQDRQFCFNDVLTLAHEVIEIPDIDSFIDTCYELSNNDEEQLVFPTTKHLRILKLNYKNDVLMQNNAPVLTSTCFLPTTTYSTQYRHVFFAPLQREARVYFYSQTRFGCVRAFDRLLQNNNLANNILDIVHKSNTDFCINYCSLKLDKDYPFSFCIDFCPGETFANETYYMRHRYDYVFKYFNDKKIFFINPDNIKLVVDNDLNKDMTSASVTTEEVTFFPDCLLGTNLQYKLTPSQISIYEVVQYQREKLILEMNSIPTGILEDTDKNKNSNHQVRY